jgi:hypothetical protein
MAVDRGDDRLRKGEDRFERAADGRQKDVEVRGAAAHDAQQIHAGGKDRPRRGDDDRLRGRARAVVERIRQRVAELEVERVRLAVDHRENGHVVAVGDFNHRVRSGEFP